MFLHNNIKIKSYPDLCNIALSELLIMDIKRAEMEGVNKQKNLPSLLKGSNNKGIFLIHNLSASPHEMRHIADYVNKLGYNVYNARVAGHGTMVENAKKLNFIDWYDSLKYGYFALKKISKELHIIGKTTGAMLGLLISLFNNVDSLVLILPKIKNIKRKISINIIRYFSTLIHNINSNNEREETSYKFIPYRNIKQHDVLCEYINKNCHIFNKNIPITIHFSNTENILEYNKIFAILKKLKDNNAIINKYN